MTPVFKEKIWGGERLRKEYGYKIPSNHTGECWAVSAHPEGDCVVSEGTYAGMHLSELWDEHRELFGNMEGDVFPLLTKVIDANDDLSIQVHPDDKYAAVHENGSLGKMECWYILDCDEDASIILGHNAKTKEELSEMIEDGRWNDLLREIHIKKNDFFQINPGTVHAIKSGTLVLESQQSSDITYRLYDYDRVQDGKKRELHLDKSLDIINVPFDNEKVKTNSTVMGDSDEWLKMLYSCKYYTIWKGDLSGEKVIPKVDRFAIVSMLGGEAELDGEKLEKGDHFIIPSCKDSLVIKGKAELIISAPGE